jgi:hypothetical protein
MKQKTKTELLDSKWWLGEASGHGDDEDDGERGDGELGCELPGELGEGERRIWR